MSTLLLDWRRVLIYTHRWLGILGSLLFLAWFVSGIVLMYAGMPALSPEERLERMESIDLSAARITPAEAASRHRVSPDRLWISMLGGRPVYRFVERGLTTTVFADDTEQLEPLTTNEAVAAIAKWAPEHAANLRYVARLREPDQWTLQSQQFLPVHKVALGDPGDTHLYVSECVRQDREAGHEDIALDARCRVCRCSVALVVLHAIPAAWRGLGSVCHMALDCRLCVVSVWPGLGVVAVVARPAIPPETASFADAVRRAGALASLRGSSLRAHNIHLDPERRAFARPVELASAKLPDGSAADRGLRRIASTWCDDRGRHPACRQYDG